MWLRHSRIQDNLAAGTHLFPRSSALPLYSNAAGLFVYASNGVR